MPVVLLESMERIKNTAQPEDIAKVFRANGLKSVDMAVVAMTSDEFSEKYLEVILDILRQTKRPLEKMVAQALRDATYNAVPQDLATKFARAVCDVVEQCRTKKKNMSSGVRLPKHLALIVAQLDKPSDLSAKAVRVAARLDEVPLPVQSSSSGSMDGLSSEIVGSYKLASLSKAGPSSREAAARKRKVSETIVLESSQEDPPAKEPAAAAGRTWIDTHRKTMARVGRDGAVKYAKLTEGPGGFAVAHFTGSSPGAETEIPNILAQPVPAVQKKPAAAIDKKPAAAPSMKKPAAAEKAPDSEDEGDEEDLECEAEEEELAEDDQEVAPESSVQVTLLKSVQSPVFGKCRATYCKEKAYIQFASTECKSGWKSICNFTEGISNHKLAVNEIMNKLKKPGYGMDQVKADKIRLIGASIDVD